jgi:adenylate kinase family enzyme
VGPPGSNRKDNAGALAEYFGWDSISVGDLLRKEVSKKSDFGRAISECLKHYRYGIPQEFMI